MATRKARRTSGAITHRSAAATQSGVGMMVFVAQSTWAQDLAETVATGAGWIRMDIPIGPYGNLTGSVFTPDTTQAAFYNQACQQAKAAGLKICLDIGALYPVSGSEATYNTNNAAYLRSISQNIGQYVDLWQVFNENDGSDYRTQTGITMDQPYLDRFAVAMASARTALQQYSTAPVTTNPFGYPVDEARYTRWQTFYDTVGASCDVIGVDAYPEKSATNISNIPLFLNRFKARYGKPVAVLEFGLPSVASYGTYTEVGQTIVDQIAAVMSADPLCAALYEVRDRGTDTTDGEDMFGLMDINFNHKSYYGAVQTEVLSWRGVVTPPPTGTETYAQVIARVGSILYLTLDNTSGTTSPDASGLNRNGTLSGSYTLSAASSMGNSSLATAFTPTGFGQVSVAHNAAFNFGTGTADRWSVVFRLKPTSIPTGWPGLMVKGDSGATNGGWGIYLGSPEGSIVYKAQGSTWGSDFGDATKVAVAGTWAHWALVWNGSVLSWYKNGTVLPSASTALPANTPTNTTAFILNKVDDWGDNVLDEVSLHSTALTSQNIADLATAQSHA